MNGNLENVQPPTHSCYVHRLLQIVFPNTVLPGFHKRTCQSGECYLLVDLLIYLCVLECMWHQLTNRAIKQRCNTVQHTFVMLLLQIFSPHPC